MEILHFLGKTYGRRPSSLIGLTDELAALNFDACVLRVGAAAEAEAWEEGGPKDREGERRNEGHRREPTTWNELVKTQR